MIYSKYKINLQMAGEGMKKVKFQGFCWLYLIEIALNIIAITVVVMYADICTVPIYLDMSFAFAVGKFYYIICILILLSIFLFLNLILFILSLFKDKYESLKKGALILPLIFLFLFPFSFASVSLTTETKSISVDEYCSSSDIQNNKPIVYYSNQSNKFAKAVYYEQNVYLQTDSWADEPNTVDYFCEYRQSDKPYIFDKFRRYDRELEDIIRKDKIRTDDYIAYYYIADNYTYYAIEINKTDEFYVSYYKADGKNFEHTYTVDEFIDDSLRQYQIYTNQ